MLGQTQGSTSVLDATPGSRSKLHAVVCNCFTFITLKVRLKRQGIQDFCSKVDTRRGDRVNGQIRFKGEGWFNMRFVVAIVVLMAVLAGLGMAGIQVAGENLPGGNAALPGLILVGGENLPGGN